MPNSEAEWNAWSFAHRTSHQLIISAVKQQKQVDLQEYPVDPINFDRVTDMLASNQQMHIAFSGALGLQSVDLGSVDFKDDAQVRAWIFLHYSSHRDAEIALGV